MKADGRENKYKMGSKLAAISVEGRWIRAA